MAAEEPVDYTQLTSLFVVSTVLTSISTVLIIVRVWVRFFALKKASMDDYMAISALIFTIGYLVALFVEKDNGLGYSMSMLTNDDMESQLKIAFAVEIIYYFVITSVKSSIVFMYDRFAISVTFKRICLYTNIFLLVFMVVYLIVTVMQCQPLQKAWNISRYTPGSCINVTAFFYFSATINIVLDVWILVIPIPTVKSLHVSKGNRRVLFAIFGIAGFGTACSCARLYAIRAYTQATDPFRHGVLLNLWSMVEINIAIWCACAPALKPVFSPRRFISSRKTSEQNSPENSHPVNSRPGVHGSTSQSHIVPIHNSNRSSSPRGSTNSPQDVELGLP
ncbi:uncharacterized protein GGS22DRAFT_189417 [Annulohypoxylon maeteangense]|uniref:uncharacterized protein n=1 Tax=Annulohypoxylon maeteangense TaxID=1927788 RepID=UPI00200793C4|nr:uncharacterized protein GGS22DRAFT_189417 [Annulohypoxylon maeteangense]KAI0884289.1 hypothetical protein GGS22DRAFT_189417 [Annulohypoxylon maeteangense]